jgi:hypothetical protein
MYVVCMYVVLYVILLYVVLIIVNRDRVSVMDSVSVRVRVRV